MSKFTLSDRDKEASPTSQQNRHARIHQQADSLNIVFRNQLQ